MKVISASIVVLAGAIMLTGGSHILHSDTKLFVQIIGSIVILMGLAAWVICAWPDHRS